MTEPTMTVDNQPQPCDLLIAAGWVVPVNPIGQVLADHAVVITDGTIVALLPTAQARERFVAAECVSRPTSVVMPGLINAHVHNPMTQMRGVADDLPLMRWLTEPIRSEEHTSELPSLMRHS